MKKIFRNISFSIGGNAIMILVSICMILVLPKYLSLQDYGRWQLFLFYSSYVGFLHFGWEDGIYLRYAGLSYKELDKSLIFGQTVAIIISQCLLGLGIYLLAEIFIPANPQKEIFLFIAVILIFANSNNLFSFIFQMTSRINDYARLIALEPLLFISLAMLAIIAEERNYTVLVYCKLISLIMVFLFGSYLLRDLLQTKLPSVTAIYNEAKEDILVGSKLMLANIASMLVIGIVRFGISQGWDVMTFGKISLTLSISNFLMVFINAVSVVFLPALKHVADSRRQQIYLAGRNLLTASMLAMLLLYYPLNSILSWWLPQYIDSLTYMAVLFPICLFETRMGLLINTYLKAMRQEKLMLKINALSVLFSVAITFFTVVIIHSLTICVVSIVLIFTFRYYFAELKLTALLQCQLLSSMVQEIIMIIVFMTTSWFVGGAIGAITYALAWMIYLIYNHLYIKNSVKIIQKWQ